MSSQWPANWERLIRGQDCEMCASLRPDEDQYGIRVHSGRYTDAYLQRAAVQRGYTLVIWRGRHITEPTELTEEEASGYWSEVLAVARGLISYYQPLKMNYETLGNSLPHLHTHLVPRYRQDPAPGQPFPLAAQDGTEQTIPQDRLEHEARALRSLLVGTSR